MTLELVARVTPFFNTTRFVSYFSLETWCCCCVFSLIDIYHVHTEPKAIKPPDVHKELSSNFPKHDHGNDDSACLLKICCHCE